MLKTKQIAPVLVLIVAGGLSLIFQNAVPVTPISFAKQSVTTWTNFQNYCAYWNGPNNSLTNPVGNCKDRTSPLEFGISQMSPSGQFPSSLADFEYLTDVGPGLGANWLDAFFTPAAAGQKLDLVLDTSKQGNRINSATNLPLLYGHTGISLIDKSVKVSLDNSLYLEFDMSVPVDMTGTPPPPTTSFVNPGNYAGHEIKLSFKAEWLEKSPRSNTAHYFEVILSETPDYSLTFLDPTLSSQDCQDTTYQRCLFDPQGVLPEVRALKYDGVLQNSSVSLNSKSWTHIRIPISDVLKSLKWVSPPSDWSQAQLSQLTVSIESMGPNYVDLQIQNYQVYQSNPAISVYSLPLGLVRFGQGSLLSKPEGLCILPDPKALQSYGFNSMDYANSILLSANSLPSHLSIDACPLPDGNSGRRALFRIGNSVYLENGQFYCRVISKSALLGLGFGEQDLQSSPQVFVPGSGLLYTGYCSNPG